MIEWAVEYEREYSGARGAPWTKERKEIPRNYTEAMVKEVANHYSAMIGYRNVKVMCREVSDWREVPI